MRFEDSRRSLVEDGYCLIPQVLDGGILDRVRTLVTSDNWPAAERERIAALLPGYAGEAAPLPWNRSPTWVD